MILLMAEIRRSPPLEVGSLSHDLQQESQVVVSGFQDGLNCQRCRLRHGLSITNRGQYMNNIALRKP